MRAVAGQTQSTVLSSVTARWQALDPLLPLPSAAAGCGAELVVSARRARPAAFGVCDHWQGAPRSLDLTWGAARRFQLGAWLAGPDVPGSLDRLIGQWRDHLADLPDTGADDSAAIITWPSRDITGVATLLRRGFAPLAVVAARRADRSAAWPESGAAAQPGAGTPGAGRAAGPARLDLVVRRAGPADVDVVVRLGMEIIRFDAHFGGVIVRPHTEQALWQQAAGMLAAADPWIWLAERDGTPVGMLYAERPESATWIAPMVGLAPVAYLELMVVRAGERSRGVGAALVAEMHATADAAGVAVTLLHYAQVNPLSAPFWGQHGYRPLWHIWETAGPRHSLTLAAGRA